MREIKYLPLVIRTYLVLALFVGVSGVRAQTEDFAEHIRAKYDIPELNYAVISSEKILEIHALGTRKIGSDMPAALSDKFRIGSNTKTITAYMAAVLVKRGKLRWDTKFFDLYPELKLKSNPAYFDLRLKDLLSFRSNLIKWSYGNVIPAAAAIHGDEKRQRYEFMSWVLQQDPIESKGAINFSNPGYVAAGLMLEKVTGRDYTELVRELAKHLGVEFEFGQPNLHDLKQTWGHDENLVPEQPAGNYRLNWLLAAGNINVTLPGYIKFIQLQLSGLAGKSPQLTAREFNFMHYGLPGFAIGWNWYVDNKTHLTYSWHRGNPGTFFTKILLCKDTNRAYLFFTNVDSEKVEEGVGVLFDELSKKYDH